MRIKPLITVLSLVAALALVALVPAALAQTPPPAAAEKQAAPMKPRAAPAEEVASKGVAIAEKAQKCLKILDDPQARLDCYDAAVRPEPNRNPPPVKGIRDCRHIVDINDRLGCFDGFAQQIPKFTHYGARTVRFRQAPARNKSAAQSVFGKITPIDERPKPDKYMLVSRALKRGS